MGADTTPQFPDRAEKFSSVSSDIERSHPFSVVVYGAGDIVVQPYRGHVIDPDEDNDTVTLTVSSGAAEAGFQVPFRCRVVKAATTATDVLIVS